MEIPKRFAIALAIGVLTVTILYNAQAASAGPTAYTCKGKGNPTIWSSLPWWTFPDCPRKPVVGDHIELKWTYGALDEICHADVIKVKDGWFFDKATVTIDNIPGSPGSVDCAFHFDGHNQTVTW